MMEELLLKRERRVGRAEVLRLCMMRGIFEGGAKGVAAVIDRAGWKQLGRIRMQAKTYRGCVPIGREESFDWRERAEQPVKQRQNAC